MPTAKTFLAQIGSFAPAPILLAFGQWSNVFDQIGLANPTWDASAGAFGTGLGAVASLVTQQIVDRSDPPKLKVYAIATLIVFSILSIYCFIVGHSIDQIGSAAFRGALASSWPMAFAAAMAALTLTLTFAALANAAKSTWLYWVAVLAGGVIAVLIAYGLFKHFGPTASKCSPG